MLSLPYSELQYNSYDADDGAEEPSFLIEYTDTDTDGAAEGIKPPHSSSTTPAASRTASAGSSADALLASGKAQLVVWTAQAAMIDTLVSRYIETLADWEDFLKQRKQERMASYRPSAAARGRKQEARPQVRTTARCIYHPPRPPPPPPPHTHTHTHVTTLACVSFLRIELRLRCHCFRASQHN